MNCSIIGAGQLGSRHLQGLLQFSSNELNVFVVDPFQDSLNIAKQRAQEVSHSHTVVYCSSILEIPFELDFVIIATNSKVRLSVLEILLSHAKVRFLILEKVLFPSIEQYEKASALILKNNVSCWVNHPRRMFKQYKALRERINQSKSYSFQVVGANWGLACNGLHFIDLFEYVVGQHLTSISCSHLNGVPFNSKRNGYVEFHGTITGMIGANSIFSITSLENDTAIAPSICIMTDDFKCFIQESGNSGMYSFDLENDFKLIVDPFMLKFQSQLTSRLLEQLLVNNTCELTPFSQAKNTHVVFVQSILNHWNSATNSTFFELPIT